MKVAPLALEGRRVRLVPLTAAHTEALAAIAFDPTIWTWYPYAVNDRNDLKAYIDDLVSGQSKGVSLPWVTTIKDTGEVVGSTSFLNIDARNFRVEIGSTWLAPPWQRTFVNTEAKLLMLEHAFERLGCLRVELKTDALNERSRAAIRRLGATEEGLLRSHVLVSGGRRRDTVYYSVLKDEWPSVKASLLQCLDA